MDINEFQYSTTVKAPPMTWEPLTHPEVSANGQAVDVPIAYNESPVSSENLHDLCEQMIREKSRLSFEAGREQGFADGLRAERDVHAASELEKARERSQSTALLIESFHRDSERYFEIVEAEVVRLALAIAARILRRESQMDPLLLTGAVRVALRQLSASTEVRMLVPPDELDLWTEAVHHMPNLPVRPAVVARDGMRLGECRIETALGSADLGVRAQLAEIERGFFDRVGGKPAASPGSGTSKGIQE